MMFLHGKLRRGENCRRSAKNEALPSSIGEWRGQRDSERGRESPPHGAADTVSRPNNSQVCFGWAVLATDHSAFRTAFPLITFLLCDIMWVNKMYEPR